METSQLTSRAQESKEFLQSILQKGSKLYTILRKVSRSGMSIEIDVFYFDAKGEKYYLSWHASNVLDWNMGKHGVKVSGCGMDMGLHLVYSLSCCLFENKDNGDTGYYLRQEWL
jgi:hypothetical protein